MNDSIKPLQVLLSEGSSTSAREAITILGLSGHRVEICDPSPWCLGRYSRFVRKFHHCPALRDNPYGYLAFVEELLAQRHFDVLLPTHEQGFLFARVAERLRGHAGSANALARGRFGAHLLDINSVRRIESTEFG
jgi:hypothetical protein